MLKKKVCGGKENYIKHNNLLSATQNHSLKKQWIRSSLYEVELFVLDKSMCRVAFTLICTNIISAILPKCIFPNAKFSDFFIYFFQIGGNTYTFALIWTYLTSYHYFPKS